MKKILKIAFGILFLISFKSNAQETNQSEKKETSAKVIPVAEISNGDGLGLESVENKSNEIEKTKPNLYNIKVKDINGKDFNFKDLKGKKILIVNTASKCGFTPQYKELESLYKKNKDKNFIVIGFPSNDFGAQEPGTNKEIATFCTKNYGVTFSMMSKVSVKGKEICPLYKFLTQKVNNGLMDSEVNWNFQKYLINEKGELVAYFDSKVSPLDDRIVNWILN